MKETTSPDPAKGTIIPQDQPTKKDLNMTQPINSDALKQGRKIVNDFVGQEINIPKMRETSINYNTIQNSDEASDRVNNFQKRA